MNLAIILTVCTVLLIYCNHSWQQVALATDLQLQRAAHLQNFYRCEGLLNYGQLLFQQNYPKLKALEIKTKKPHKSAQALSRVSSALTNPENLSQPETLKLHATSLYTGPWPLNDSLASTPATNVTVGPVRGYQTQGQLTATFSFTKQNWQLVSTLLDQSGHPLCQISCLLEPVKQKAAYQPSDPLFKISNWAQN